MSKISEIDRNLAVKDKIEGAELSFFDVRRQPFSVFGLLPGAAGEPFRRIPEEVAQATNSGVVSLNTNTAGGRVRFQTDSACVAIRAKMPQKCLMSHMPFLGSSGFDLYLTEGQISRYAGSFMPSIDRTDGYESIIRFHDRSLRDITINFPLYDAVDELLIGLEPDALLQSGSEYRKALPVLYYGSSITQGGCASRPGNSYQAVISRRCNCDYRNLGWSGSARGEQAIADYIAAQPMSLFFMDYDHNSPSPEHLAQTHEPFFLTVREKNPELPIILATKTDPPRSPQEKQDRDERRNVVIRTYENALRRGDKNVRFIDGGAVFSSLEAHGLTGDSCTVDGCHPNDLGFLCMANVFGREIAQMLGW